MLTSMRFVVVAIFLVLAVATESAAIPRALEALLATHRADSLVLPLRRFEAEQGQLPLAGEAALLLGRLHYARGEYRLAAEAFARAAARLDPSRKPEARYWGGLSWLALKEPNQARAALEDVAQSDSPRRAEALLGVALAWQLSERPDRALEVLGRLLEGDPGEAGPAALEEQIAIAVRLHRPDLAARAFERLTREYPRSMEAARAVSPRLPPEPQTGNVAVEIGEFANLDRAHALVGMAQRAGYDAAQVVERGEGTARSHAVQLGVYPGLDEARQAGDEAARKLGVSYRLVGAP